MDLMLRLRPGAAISRFLQLPCASPESLAMVEAESEHAIAPRVEPDPQGAPVSAESAQAAPHSLAEEQPQRLPAEEETAVEVVSAEVATHADQNLRKQQVLKQNQQKQRKQRLSLLRDQHRLKKPLLKQLMPKLSWKRFPRQLKIQTTLKESPKHGLKPLPVQRAIRPRMSRSLMIGVRPLCTAFKSSRKWAAMKQLKQCSGKGCSSARAARH
ncbi:unnamed protein product [Effrenium voratum]|nr:unnamed protein product [Effrenium voratum]